MPSVTNRKKPKGTNRKIDKAKHAEVEQKEQDTKDEKFSFDQEIVIGLRRIDDEPKQEAKNKKKRNKVLKEENNQKRTNQKTKSNNREKKQPNRELENKDIIIKSKYMQNYEETEDNNENIEYKSKNTKRNNSKNNKQKTSNSRSTNAKLTKKQQAQKKRKKRIIKVIKCFTLIGIIIAGIVYALLSPIFNIKNINVSGNTKISSETIISLSGLNIEQNIFNFRTSYITDNIKQNAYIDNVEIHRKLPDEIEIMVQERVATYMLTLGNAYVYINNQGYILEITATKGDFPLIVGYETQEEQIQEGNRLNTDDLEKLNDVLRIMEAASSVGGNITSLVTQIDISDKSNYILTLEKEKKKIYLGDTTNLSAKMLWINELLKIEKNNEGAIYLNIDLNTERPYFREKV